MNGIRFWSVAFVLIATANLFAEDWPRWRGPHQDGVSRETGWSLDWPASGPPRLWEAAVGSGNGSVAIVGNRVYTIGSQGRTNDSDTVYCFDANTGKVLWKHSYARRDRSGYERRTPTKQGPTNSTPTVDGDVVYTFSGDAQLFCFDRMTGKVRWSRDLMDELGVRHPQYDHNASPLIVENMIVLPVRLPDASIAAFDKQTGKEVWRVHHATRRGALGGFWSTPVFANVDGKPCLVYLTGLAVIGLDPKTGKTQWKYDFAESGVENAAKGAVAASPIVYEDKVFFPFHPDHGRGFSACIEVKASKPRLLWKSMKLAHWWHSPVLWKGRVYALDQGPRAETHQSGALYCYDLATGKLMWSTYAIGEDSRSSATKGGKLLIVDGKLFLLNDYGSLLVADLADTGPTPLAGFKAIRRQGRLWSVPVLANGRLYCRSGRGEFFCFDVRGRKTE